MKKIAILNYHMACGGTEKALLALLNSIDYKNIEVTLYLLFKDGPLLNDIPSQVDVQEVKFKDEKYRYFVGEIKKEKLLLRTQRKLFKLINRVDYEQGTLFEAILDKVVLSEKEYDVVCDFSGYASFLSVMAARLFNAKKRCMWIHDENCFWLSRIKNSISYYDKIFCVSKSVKKSFIDMFPEYKSKAQIFYNLIDVKEIINKGNEFCVSDIMNEKYTLLTVGRIVKQKGYDIAVETASILKHRGIPFRWYFIGDGKDFDDMKNRVLNLELQQEIVMLGSKANPYPYMKKCTLYVQPSRNEGYPVVLVEARALECVIVATSIPSIREQIIDDVNGYLANVDAKCLANKIEELLLDTNKQEKVKYNLRKEKIDFSSEIVKLYDLM